MALYETYETSQTNELKHKLAGLQGITSPQDPVLQAQWQASSLPTTTCVEIGTWTSMPSTLPIAQACTGIR